MPAIELPTGLVSELRAIGLNPTDLVFYINSGCNLRCRHCYVGTELLDTAAYYSLPSMLGFFNDLPMLDRVTVLGGEPFFHPQLIEIVNALGRHRCSERRITTNLTVVDEQILSALREAGFRVCVSLDGHTDALHDKLRGASTFVRAAKNLRRVIRDGFDVEVTHTVTSENISYFWEFIAFCKSIGLRRLNLHRVSLRGNALANRQLDVGATAWRNLTASIEGQAEPEENGLSVRYEVGFATEAEFQALVAAGNYHHHSRASFYSQSGGSRVVIFPNQHVYISSEAFGTNSHVGDFVSGKFIFNESPANELLASQASGFSTTAINSEIAGDKNYPIPLSVSFRKTTVV